MMLDTLNTLASLLGTHLGADAKVSLAPPLNAKDFGGIECFVVPFKIPVELTARKVMSSEMEINIVIICNVVQGGVDMCLALEDRILEWFLLRGREQLEAQGLNCFRAELDPPYDFDLLHDQHRFLGVVRLKIKRIKQ